MRGGIMVWPGDISTDIDAPVRATESTGGADCLADGLNAGVTLLIDAAARGNAGVAVKLIEEVSIDVNATDKHRRTAFMAAFSGRHYKLAVELLCRGAKADDSAKNDLLLWAACNGFIDDITKLAEAGVNLDAADQLGLTLLHKASHDGRANVVKALLDGGANVNAITASWVTPLYLASQNGHIDVVKALLGYGADVNAVCGPNLWTPLHKASHDGRANVVKALLDGGANVNAISASGATPLKFAIQGNNHDVVVGLVNKGAKIYFYDIAFALYSKNIKTAYHLTRNVNTTSGMLMLATTGPMAALVGSATMLAVSAVSRFIGDATGSTGSIYGSSSARQNESSFMVGATAAMLVGSAIGSAVLYCTRRSDTSSGERGM